MKNLSFLILFVLILSTSCQNSSTLLRKATQDQYTQALNLKEGMKIILEHQSLDVNSSLFGQNQRRVVTLETAGGAEGLSFHWQKEKPIQTKVPVRMMTPETPSHFALPNLNQARRMTLPALWPEGSLYLSNSSGLWISDVAFAELRKKRRSQFQPGLLDNPLLGPAQEFIPLEKSLLNLNQKFNKNLQSIEKQLEIKSKRRREKFSIKLNGKTQEVSVLVAEQELAQYKILDNLNNPLVVEVKLFPKAKPGEILFSPLVWAKGLLEYRVVEVENL